VAVVGDAGQREPAVEGVVHRLVHKPQGQVLFCHIAIRGKVGRIPRCVKTRPDPEVHSIVESNIWMGAQQC
jgi:hypothetical protein